MLPVGVVVKWWQYFVLACALAGSEVFLGLLAFRLRRNGMVSGFGCAREKGNVWGGLTGEKGLWGGFGLGLSLHTVLDIFAVLPLSAWPLHGAGYRRTFGLWGGSATILINVGVGLK